MDAADSRRDRGSCGILGETLDEFARLSVQERADVFAATAEGIGLPVAYVEKDYWVCWILKRIFELNLNVDTTFKGGTSLSKVFAAINRFSEDVDLALNYHHLGFTDEKDPLRAESGRKRKDLGKEIRHKAQEHVRKTLLPALSTSISEALDETETLLVDSSPGSPDASLSFYYPTTPLKADRRPTVLLEFGARGKGQPAQFQDVMPYAAEKFPNLFAAPRCRVRVLDLGISLWEKVTILHVNHYMKSEKPLRPNAFRDYSDVAMLAALECGKQARQDVRGLADVVLHKSILFASNGYDSAKHGSLRLSPPPGREKEIRASYNSMRDMYYGKAPTLESVLETLAKFELELNTPG